MGAAASTSLPHGGADGLLTSRLRGLLVEARERGHIAAFEWTGRPFAAYPGFTAFPYREYSEACFRSGHMVLRGGSWATRPRVARPTFRNWDHPERRQIFAGFRCARDA